MSLDSTQQTAMGKPLVASAWFVELSFLSATVRVCSYGQTYPWGGHDWIGLGSLGKISPIDEKTGVLSSAMTFSLNSSQISLLAAAAGDVEEYRNRDAVMYFCPLHVDGELIGTLIGTPDQCWRGRMDQMGFSLDGEEGQITLKCETSSFGLKRTSMRLNSAQQKQRYPGDTGFDYLEDLIANPQKWLSVKFQQI